MNDWKLEVSPTGAGETVIMSGVTGGKYTLFKLVNKTAMKGSLKLKCSLYFLKVKHFKNEGREGKRQTVLNDEQSIVSIPTCS